MSLAKATHQQTRALNQGLVLRTLYDRGPISRAEVARLTGLTRTTVSELMTALITDGLAREVGRGPSSGGKAPILVEVVADSRLVIGLDLGELAFVGALVNLRGEIRHIAERQVDGRDGKAALASVEALVDELLRAAKGPVLGIGVGTPGLVDTQNGTIGWAVNLDWEDLPLGSILRDRTGLPTYVANDARAVAMGEYLFSSSSSRGGSLVAIKVGLGIGAGIVLNGELFHGDGSGAGEIGHATVQENGSACRCGRFGCLETVASSRAILRAAQQSAEDRPQSHLGKLLRAQGRLELSDLAAAMDAGDELARRIVVAAARSLGQSIAGMIGLLNVRRIVLLGSVTKLGEPWLEAVRDEARRRSLGLLSNVTEIEIGHHQENVVVLGAVALLMTRELGLVPLR